VVGPHFFSWTLCRTVILVVVRQEVGGTSRHALESTSLKSVPPAPGALRETAAKERAAALEAMVLAPHFWSARRDDSQSDPHH
jgi:hypothetical protein